MLASHYLKKKTDLDWLLFIKGSLNKYNFYLFYLFILIRG